MCEPATLTMTALSVASSAAQAGASYQQGKAYNKAIGQEMENQNEADAFNYRNMLNSLADSARIEQADREARSRQARRELSQLRAMGVEANALGDSFEKLQMDTMQRAGYDMETIEANAEANRGQMYTSIQASRLESNQRFASLSSKATTGTNPFYTGLTIAAAGGQGYAQGKSIS